GLGAGTPEDLRRACWEIGRIAAQTPVLATLDTIAHAALHTVEGQPRRALDLLAPVSADGETGRRRNSVRVFAARLARHRETRVEVLRDVARWARRTRGGDAHAFFCECLAWERYAEGRFAVAAHLH